MHWHSPVEAFIWIFGLFLGAIWLSRIAVVWLNRKSVADISAPEYDVPPKTPTRQKKAEWGTLIFTAQRRG